MFALNLLLAVTAAQAQTVVQAWIQRYDGPANGDDYTQAIAVDGSGDLIATGYPATIKYSSAGVALWTNTASLIAIDVVVDGSNNVIVIGSPVGDWVYTTIKYSSAGTPLWTNLYHGPGNGSDFATSVAVDSSNNVIVTGSSFGIGSDYDYATIKYSSDGVPLWTNRYNAGNSTDAAYAVAVDGKNDIIITGTSFLGASVDYATIKYSSDGVPVWTNRDLGAGYLEVGNVIKRVLAVDANNDAIVTGVSSDLLFATIKYSSAGVTLWNNRYSASGDGGGVGWAVAVDSSNNVIVTGYSIGSSSSYDYGTIKYSGGGVPLWTNRHNGLGNGPDFPQAIAVDSSNNVIVTGQSKNGTNFDYATIAYSSVGVPLWTNLYNGPGNGTDDAYDVAVDRSGNVFVNGISWNGTNYDYATIKYSASLPPIPLNIQTLNNQVVLSWTNAAFGLQSAPALTGTFTNMPGATSPYTNALNGDQRYFRLISN